MDEPIQRLGRCPCCVYTESLDDTVIVPAIAFNLILQAKKAAFLPPDLQPDTNITNLSTENL